MTQTRGTFPALYDSTARRKPKRVRHETPVQDDPLGSFTVKRAPRPVNAPKDLAGRRAASHRKAYGSS